MVHALEDSNPPLVVFDGRFLPAEVVEVSFESEPNPIAPDVVRNTQQYRLTLVTRRDPIVLPGNHHNVMLCTREERITLTEPMLSNINKQLDGSWEVAVHGTGHRVRYSE